MRLNVHHVTRYDFEQPVIYGLSQVRNTVRPTPNQHIVSWQTRCEGATQTLHYKDHHGNAVSLISLEAGTRQLRVITSGEIEVSDSAGIIGPHEGPAPLWLYETQTVQTTAGAGVAALMQGLEPGPALARMHELSARVRARVAYRVGASESTWSAEEALAAGRGVCADHTHIFLAAARQLGLPARYVSGYLMLNDRVAQDAMHAWAEVHIQDLGWVGFDISNGIAPDARYVRVATGLDYRDAAPLSGSRIGGAGESLSVSIHVEQQ